MDQFATDKHVLPQAGRDVEQQLPEVPQEVVVGVPPPPPVTAELQPEPVELPKLVLAFCLTVASGIAVQSIQNQKDHPLTFQLMCLTMIFAFTSIVGAEYVHQNYPNEARVLKNAGLLFGITAFFFAITMLSPIWITIIAWFTYVVLLVVIVYCNYLKYLPS